MHHNNNKLSCQIRIILLGIAILVLISDIVSKFLAYKYLTFAVPYPIMPFLSFRLIYNSGAAFSFLANAGGWQRIFFIVLALIVAIYLIFYILKSNYSILSGIGFSFILGGALGNLINRIFVGKVLDFIDAYYQVYHWPTFNVADSFITIGVILIFVNHFLFNKSHTHARV